MVEIIKGTFGYFDGKKVKPITQKDGPQTFDSELEERLVKQGVARYVRIEDPEEIDEKGNENSLPLEDSEKDLAPESSENNLPAYDRTMKLNDLKEIAKLYGVDASRCTAKVEVCDLIDAKLAEDSDEGDEEDDGQPDLSPAAPV